MKAAFPLADPSISGQLPVSRAETGKVPRAKINFDGLCVNRDLGEFSFEWPAIRPEPRLFASAARFWIGCPGHCPEKPRQISAVQPQRHTLRTWRR